MKICQVISSIDLKSGGPSKSVSDLSSILARNHTEVVIITKYSESPYKINNLNNLNINYLHKGSFSKELKKEIIDGNYSLLHGHGIWKAPIHFMAKIARHNGIPYIISPRGMLDEWCLRQKIWKKRLALYLYQKNDIVKASCVHAATTMELENIRKIGIINPVAVIPNGLNLSEFNLSVQVKNNLNRKILFLSRIHPQKGIEYLIEAFSKTDNSIIKNWHMDVVGNGNVEYIQHLNQMIVNRHMEKKIFIKGPKYGIEKINLYQEADLFILPSHSESFGMVIVEALASGVPVVTTKGTPWEVLNIRNAGWWIDVGVDPLKNILETILKLPNRELHTMGSNGRKLIEEKYSLDSVGNKMVELYTWVLKKGKRPDFVDV